MNTDFGQYRGVRLVGLCVLGETFVSFVFSPLNRLKHIYLKTINYKVLFWRACGSIGGNELKLILGSVEYNEWFLV